MKDYIGVGYGDDIQKSIEEATAGLNDSKIIFVFAEASKFKEVVGLVGQKYPSAIVIGTTGYSFANRNIVKDNVVVWAMKSGVEVEAGVLQSVKTFPIKDIKPLEDSVKRIDAGNDNTVCMEFCTGSEEKIVSTLSSAISKKNIPLIGGTAQGADRDGVKCVSLNGEIYNDACVYVLIKNTDGKVKVYSENIYKVKSENFVATKVDVENRRILELNRKSAAKVYCETLGITKDEISNYVLTNPLARVIGKEEFLTAIKLVGENGDLSCFKRINQNDVLNILELIDYKEAINNTLKRIKDDFSNISSIFSVNCIYRFMLFESRNFTGEYAQMMSSIGQHIGIIGEGEQYNKQHVNQTMVCVVFE
ncbi:MULTISPECIES: FIST N-terminal domain-containing protein [Clostridium]|uniref:FIST C-terminal domain-containing protein n=1 Tax=Clostridium cibarium TaxID=2762247 RepID=A0ABR8PUM7_9CLOT|nr:MULTISPECIES: FIST N-terminal domain-containing protein [Clostridium]MBD7911871.1 FIST C-terminal domain-containing protein [Clostridium cibarium]